MNIITSADGLAIKMTSREISEMVDVRHDNVKRTIEMLANKSVIEFPQIEEIKTATKPVSAYVFYGNQGKRDSLIVVAQLCPEFTAKIVDRWQELEERAAKPVYAIPQTFAEALRLAADATEQKERYAAQLAIAAPKVEAFSRIAEADGSLGLQAAGKALQQKPNKFIAWLREQGWIYRRAGSTVNLGRAEKVNAGYLTHKVTTVEREDGTEKVVEQVLITPKGLAKLSIMFNVQEAA